MVFCIISIYSIMLEWKLFIHEAAKPSTTKIIIIFNNSFVSLPLSLFLIKRDQMNFMLFQFPLCRLRVFPNIFSRRIKIMPAHAKGTYTINILLQPIQE